MFYDILYPSDNKRSFYESEFILLPYFLYSCKHRKYLKGCKGALYQPACDQQIHPKLEESVGCKLFSRSSRGVVLTDEGKLLYEHVSEAFETLTMGEEKLKRSIELGVGHLKIGVSATLCKYLLLPYLQEFIRQNPHVSISITCQSTKIP